MVKNPSIKPSTSVGSILIRMGCMDAQQVDRAREAHSKQSAMRLGEVMVSMGLISAAQLDDALAYQERMRSGDAAGVMVELIEKRTTKMMHTAA